jgi:HAD superfamily hydrolase (TIGR01549 family)
MVIKAIIVDCFGVLTEDGWLAFLNKYVDEDRREEARSLNKQNDLNMISYDEFLGKITEMSRASREQADEMIRLHHTRNIALLELLSKLKSSYKIGLLSNVSHNFLEDFLTPEDIKLFDGLSLSGESGHLKPEPEAYGDICQKLDIESSEAIFIDDREVHVHGAREVGMLSFVYQDVPQVKRELQQAGVKL